MFQIKDSIPIPGELVSILKNKQFLFTSMDMMVKAEILEREYSVKIGESRDLAKWVAEHMRNDFFLKATKEQMLLHVLKFRMKWPKIGENNDWGAPAFTVEQLVYGCLQMHMSFLLGITCHGPTPRVGPKRRRKGRCEGREGGASPSEGPKEGGASPSPSGWPKKRRKRQHSDSMNMMNLINIEKLNGSNFKSWKQQIQMQPGIMEFSIAFKLPKPATLTAKSTKEEKENFEKWEMANSMSLLIMQNAMENNIRGGFADCELAKDYMTAIEEKYKRSDKAEISAYLQAFINAKHDGTSSIREHLLNLVHIANKLNSLEIGITDQFLVHMALHSLSDQYEQIKVNYCTQKETWTINELITICTDEEERKRKLRLVTVNIAHVGKRKGKAASGYKGNNPNPKLMGQKPGSTSGTKKIANNAVMPKIDSTSTGTNLKPNKIVFKNCFFCQSAEHLRKDCPGFKVSADENLLVKDHTHTFVHRGGEIGD